MGAEPWSYYVPFEPSVEAALEKALKTLGDLDKAMPSHAEAGRTLKNWMAMRSMLVRSSAGAATDYRSQVASTDAARTTTEAGPNTSWRKRPCLRKAV